MATQTLFPPPVSRTHSGHSSNGAPETPPSPFGSSRKSSPRSIVTKFRRSTPDLKRLTGDFCPINAIRKSTPDLNAAPSEDPSRRSKNHSTPTGNSSDGVTPPLPHSSSSLSQEEGRQDYFYAGRGTRRVGAGATKDGQRPKYSKRGSFWRWQSQGSLFTRRLSLGRVPQIRPSKGMDQRGSDTGDESVPDDVVVQPCEATGGSSTDLSSLPLESPSSQKQQRRAKQDDRAGGGKKKGSLYKRSKRKLRKLGRPNEAGRANQSEGSSDEADIVSEKSSTNDVLEEASHWLRVIVRSQSQGGRRRSRGVADDSSPTVSRRHRLFPQRDASVLSRSSSIMHLMMGNPPKNSPDSEAMYQGNDQRDYFRVDISAPEGPTFLPSEATRLGTPPLPGEKSGPRRGYFFDISAPPNDSRSDLEEPSIFADPAESPGQLNRVPTLTRWYGVRLDDEDEQLEQAAVEHDNELPEHLPNSPLCPTNLLHSSGGKGQCIYHGKGSGTTTPSAAGMASGEFFGAGPEGRLQS